jgi:hypothetical protein
MPREHTTARHCPFCGSDALVDGVIGGSDAYAYFQPSDLNLRGRLLASLQFRRQHPAAACRQCGSQYSVAFGPRSSHPTLNNCQEKESGSRPVTKFVGASLP